jgi:hypothetical protein
MENIQCNSCLLSIKWHFCRDTVITQLLHKTLTNIQNNSIPVLRTLQHTTKIIQSWVTNLQLFSRIH